MYINPSNAGLKDMRQNIHKGRTRFPETEDKLESSDILTPNLPVDLHCTITKRNMFGKTFTCDSHPKGLRPPVGLQ